MLRLVVPMYVGVDGWGLPERGSNVVAVGLLERGSGHPVTLFAPGGEGENLDRRMQYADAVPGTKVGFAYGDSGRLDTVRRPRRQADREASEARAVARDRQATRGIGFSRGARALLGALAQDGTLFQRVVLVIPPGGHAAGEYSTWMMSLDEGGVTPEILVIGHRGDRGHPTQVAELWAKQLGARLKILPPRAVLEDPRRVARLLAEFLS